jgi:hypothetical protein
MKCGVHCLLRVASIVKLVCGYECDWLTVMDVTSVNAVMLCILKVELFAKFLNLSWERMGSIKCCRTQASLTQMVCLSRIL